MGQFCWGDMFQCQLPLLDMFLGVVEHNSHVPEAPKAMISTDVSVAATDVSLLPLMSTDNLPHLCITVYVVLSRVIHQNTHRWWGQHQVVQQTAAGHSLE